MKQTTRTVIILLLTLLLASLAPAGQLSDSSCRSSVTAAKTMHACCQAAGQAAEASMSSDSSMADHACPQGGFCRIDGGSESYWRACGGLQPVDHVGQSLTFISQPVALALAKVVVSRPSPPVRGGAQRYILICSFLI